MVYKTIKMVIQAENSESSDYNFAVEPYNPSYFSTDGTGSFTPTITAKCS